MKAMLLRFMLAFLFMQALVPFNSVSTPAGGPQAMPPNSRLKDKILSGEVLPPAFTDQVLSRSAVGAGVSSQAALTGSLRVLALLVDFSDQVHTVSASYFDTLIFSAPVSGRGSVRDYFNEISYGAVDIVTVNMPSSTGWQLAPNTLSYYTNNDFCLNASTYPNNCQGLAEDLINAVDGVVDFSKYDNDNNGATEPIMIIHSGPGAEFTGSTGDIWSHSWNLSSPQVHDGKTVYQYTIQPEFWQTVNATTSDMTIGVFAHEMSHGFWYLPDLYDTDQSSEGLGKWSLMASGSWNGASGLGESPAWPDAWSRIQMGFTTPTTLVTNNPSLTLPQAAGSASTPTVYKVGSTVLSANEYFLLENREQAVGTYDEYLPGQGLLIWHVDEAISTQNDKECKAQPHASCPTGQHYLVALEQADGQRHLENNNNRGDGGDIFPGLANNRAWTFLTNPESSSWYATTDSLISASTISAAAASMTASVTTGLVTPTTLNVTLPTAGRADLTWTDGSADETNFRIERSIDSGNYTEIATTAKNVSTYSDTTITCGHTYTYRVRAYRNIFGGQYTPYSNTAAVTPASCPVPGAFGKASPANNASGQPRALNLTWGISSGATSYEYCYDTAPTGDCASAWTGTTGTSVSLTMPAGNTFYWQVRARNASGVTYADSSSTAKWRFDILPDPGAFAKTAPTNGAGGQPVNGVVLSWTQSTNAASYEYCLSAISASCTSGVWTTTGAALTATLPALTPGATYYWQVRAKNTNATVEASGGWWTFTVAALPGTFSKIAPANAATSQLATGLAISWGTSSNAASYEYCYSSSASCTSGVWTTTGAATTAPLPALTPGNTYYWQVRARNATGVTDANAGTWWSFTVLAQPGAFAKTAPTNGATGQLTNGLVLTWGASANATRYEYCYYTGASCITWINAGTAQTATLNSLTPNTTYTWQVRAVNINGTVYANAGTVWNFTTQPVPGQFAKNALTGGSVNQHTASLTLTWTASASATLYEYCVSTTSAACPNGIWNNAGSAQTATLTNLTAGATYYWQVRARNSTGAIYANGGDFNAGGNVDNPAYWWSFTTRAEPDTFTKTAPTNGAVNKLTSGLVLSWAASANAARYEYCVSAYTPACTTWVNNGTSRTATVSGLTPGAPYYWHVRAVNAAGTTYSDPLDPFNLADLGTWWTFSTLPLPSGFNKSLPTNGATGQATNGLALSWAASSGATSYEYCLSTTAAACPGGTWTSVNAALNGTLNSLNSGTTYYWQVRSRNSSGTTEANGGVWWTFTTQGLPAGFTKAAPANGATGQPINGLALSWNASSVDTYDYCLSSTGPACPGVWTPITIAAGIPPTTTLNGLISGTTYYWQVRARNASGTVEADSGTWWSFTTTAYPGPFSKAAPANGATNQSISSLALTWGASGNAAKYEYCYSTSSSCPGNIWTDAGTALTATITGLTANTTYFWQVRAVNGYGTTYADNGWFSFTTQPLPGSFNKTAPANGATGQLINGLALSWTAAANAASYEYCLSTSGGACPGAWTSTGANLGATLNNLTGGTTYYWQVRARNTSGTSDASGGWYSFTTLSLPGAFAKSSPANGATGQLTSGLTLNWGASNNATSYEYCYNTTATCPSDVWTQVGTAQTATLNNLNSGATYYWQVRARNANGVTAADNAWWSFTTLQLPAAFNKSAPANGATGQTVSGQVLSWGVSSYASGYEYCINTSAACPNNTWTPTGTARSVTLGSLAPGMTYYWQVRAWNVYGITYADSGWWSFTTQTSASTFNKTTPISGASGQAINSLSLAWTASSSAISYEYCVSTTGAACPNDFWTSTGAALGATLNSLTPGTTYSWQVRARNSTGTTEADGGWWTFTTLAQPGSFNKSTPANGAAGQATSGLALSWTSAQSAASYEYCFGTSNGVCPGESWVPAGASLGATLNNLTPGTTYYWQVRARNINGVTNANGGSWWSFTTAVVPGAFAKTAPANASTGSPVSGLALTWGASGNATSYEYCYNISATCSGSWTSTGSVQTATLTGLQNSTTYYWQVRARNSYGTTDANGGTWWSFTTQSSSGAFGKSAPANTTVGHPISGLVLNWGASSGATDYAYCVSATASCSTWTSTGTNRTATLGGLNANTTYYWQVRATNGSSTIYADGSASAFWSFTTQGATKLYLPYISGAPLMYTISGRITLNGAGMVGVPVYAVNNNDLEIAHTDAQGNYTLTLLPGTYELTPGAIDYTFTPASRTVTTPPNATGQDFTAAQGCTELLQNRGFETSGYWIMPATPNPASYTTRTVHNGSWALKTGLDSGDPSVMAYSSAYQQVTIPSVLTSATLEAWIYPLSGEASAAAHPELGVGMNPEKLFKTQLAASYADTQWIMLLDNYGNVLQKLYEKTSNSRAWEKYTYDLSGYRGRTVWIYFSTYNNGYGGTTGMYVDDTSLKICK